MDPIEKYRQDKKDMNAQLKTLGKKMFKPFFTNLFEEFPDIHAVRWTQYTPHFNDGDACTFSVHDPFVSIKPLKEMDDDEINDTDTAPWFSAWSDNGNPCAKAAAEVGKFFQDIEDVLETAFGDGVEVTVKRSGAITVDDYDHD